MKRTEAKSASKKKEPKVRMLSNVVKPANMGLREWQIKLRQQAAMKDNLAVSSADCVYRPGKYEVRNFQTKRIYNVAYYGEGCCLNSCTCMDFRTSGLSTCKHMEAVKASRVKKTRKLPSNSRLFVDYSGRPKIRIYYGSDDCDVIKPLAEPLFHGHEVLETGDLSFLRLQDFIAEAKAKSPVFQCTDDAMQMIDRKMDNIFRGERLDRFFADRDWDRRVFVKGIRPYEYQQEGIRFACMTGRCIIADEMGLGKTLQAIGAASILYREGYVNSILILCPTSLKYQWQREIKKFVGEDATVIEGGQTARIRQYDNGAPFKIVSYNAVSNDVRLLKSIKTDLLIMDEVQRLKNWNTQIAQSARRIEADYKIVLSGTPLENKLEELYSIVELVDPYALGPYYQFRADHIVTNATGKILEYKGLNAIGRQLEGILLRRRKKDVMLQLPERMDKNLFVPMTEEQMSIHSEFSAGVSRLVSKWQRMHFLSETDRRRLMLLLSEMRMVCDSTYILDQQSRHDTKVSETMNILESIFASGDDKVVIFSQWERMTRLIAQELDKRAVRYSYLHGGVPSAKRKNLTDSFSDDSQVRVFISTDAGATGLNLQVANYLINLDLPWNPAVLEQRIGRIYRIGQKQNIQVINLIATGTIEEQMLSKLKFKSSMASGVLDYGSDEVTLDNNRLRDIIENFEFNDNVSVPQGVDEAPAEVQATVLAGTQAEAQTEDIPVYESEEEVVAGGGMTPAGGIVVPESEDELSGNEPEVPEADNNAAENLIAEGISFMEKMLDVLGNEDSARRLVDSMVSTDSKTGRTTVNIPVKNKETVVKFVSLIGNIMRNFKK